MLGADEDSDAVEALALILQAFDLLTDTPCFFRTIPHADDADLFAFIQFGPQSFAQTRAVGVDQAAGRGKDMRRAAVVLLKLDDLRARKVLFEAQDICNFRSAPGIDALVVITDAADILSLLREQTQPEILDCVRVLIFVHKYIFELRLIFLKNIAIVLEQVQTM